VPAGQLSPGDIVAVDERPGVRCYLAALLAGRAAIETIGPGDRRRGLSGASLWLELDTAVTLVESFRASPGAAGSEVDPIRSGACAAQPLLQEPQ